MPHDLFIHAVKCVSCFPGQVALVGLFPAEDIIKGSWVARIQDIMSVTESCMARKGWWFKRPNQFVWIVIDYTTTMERHSIMILMMIVMISDHIPANYTEWRNLQLKVTIGITRVFHLVVLHIAWDNRHFTCITAVDHFYKRGVPVFRESMVTIELQLVSLVIVVTLDHLSGVVNIFGVLMPYIFQDNCRWVR